jgi:hypothetical protein
MPPPTDTPTRPPVLTPRPRPGCTGDCGGNGEVTVDELLLMVNVALGTASVADCARGDVNLDGEIAIDEILQAVNNALGECPAAQVCGGIAGLPCPGGAFCEFAPGTCNVADRAGVCQTRPLICSGVFAPVCGCDGLTYGNDCMRQSAGIAKDHEGSC